MSDLGGRSWLIYAVTPEVKNRRENGVIKENFVLTAAQVIMTGDDRPAKVRLNGEVKIISRMKLKPNLTKQKGDMISMNDFEEFGVLQLPDDEESEFAHISMIMLGNAWYLGWDARYNKGLSRKHLETAKQFYQAGEFSYQRKLWSPFIDNLFSSVELLAKSELLLMPDKKLVEKPNHATIKTRYNAFVHIGNAKSEYVQVLNYLNKVRGQARYVKSDFSITDAEAVNILNVVKDMIDYIELRLDKSLGRFN